MMSETTEGQFRILTLYQKALEEMKKQIDMLVNQHCRALDNAVERILVHPDPANISEMELERLCLEIPALVYRLEGLISSSRLHEDIAEILEKHVYQTLLKDAKGTVAEKQAMAFIGSEKQRIETKMKSYFVNRLRNKREMAEKVFDGARKVLTARMKSFDFARKDTMTA